MRWENVRNKQGFTLIELLVVIAIIAVLMGILMPSLRMAREQARKVVCLSHLSSVGKLVYLYGQDFDDNFPRQRDRYGERSNRIAAYYTYHHVPHWNGPKAGYDGLGFLYKVRLLASDSDLPFCPGMKRLFVGASQIAGGSADRTFSGYHSMHDWNAHGDPSHYNYVGPESALNQGLQEEDAQVGWLNLRFTLGWRNLETEFGVKKISMAGGAKRAFMSDVWAAKMSDYWQSHLDDMPHRTGKNCTMNVWYVDGHTKSHRWRVDEYFDKNGYLQEDFTWELLFE